MAERTSIIVINMTIWTQMKDKQKANHRAGRWSCNFWGTGEIATTKHPETSRRTPIFAA
jgi:hypothetical protein